MDIYETQIDGVRGFFIVPHLANLAKLERSFENTEYHNQGLHEAPISEKKAKTKRQSRDLNPSRSLDRAP